MSKTVTVQDIAALAKVSTATVSRTLSHPEKVSEKTRELVMKAVEETGYTVNEAARNLRKKQTDSIVVMLPNIGNEIFSSIVEAIETVCAKNGINVLIADTEKASMSHGRARAYFSKNRVDGIIILDGKLPLDTIPTGDKTPPVVYAGEWNIDANYPIASIDDALGIQLAIKHLSELGHTDIGHIAGPYETTPGKVRTDSFYQVLKQTPNSPKKPWVFDGDFSLKSGKSAAHAWFQLPKNERPTAVMCASDAMAFGFISTLTKLGIHTPRDVSVIGFDNLPVAEYYSPALTTVHQPRDSLGILAAHTLLSLINGSSIKTLKPIEPWLVERDSTAKI
ncbi:LacI family DNA-binding transcriptional regulator [Leucothrix arctica]|uniref:LacI family transcriptional regulator n=1 Tax=Leucothrix arctica TaxID=1481894 RepID=A0A317CIN1_9GAMM|nr:LacI family DNA-binding transcriptional regulator [Leucothrix arctica]PWQ96180.1 LacI family transcriptional regulator [Leucothrix arctica]